MSSIITEIELETIKNGYNLSNLKTIAKSKKVALSRMINGKRQNKKKDALISDLFTLGGRSIFTAVQWSDSDTESDDDDDDDTSDEVPKEQMQQPIPNTQSMEVDSEENGHSIIIRIYSSSFNKQITYPKFRRKLENRGSRLSNDLSVTICTHLKAEGISCDADNTMVQYTICEKPSAEVMTMKQLPPKTDEKYEKKKYALVRNQREGIVTKASNALSIINGGGLIVFHPTSDEADNKSRELNVYYLGHYAAKADDDDKKIVNDCVSRFNDGVIEKLKHEKNKNKIVISVFEDFESELKELERQYNAKEIERLEYLEKKSALTDKKLLMINGNNNNKNKNSMSEDDSDDDSDDDDDSEQPNQEEIEGEEEFEDEEQFEEQANISMMDDLSSD